MKTAFLSLLFTALAAFAAEQATASFFHFSFDGVANDTGSVVAYTNGASGTLVPDAVTGAIATTSSGGQGFHSSASLDLSSEPQFTVNFLVESSAVLESGLNGNFFGITNAVGTGGGALYNNAGAPGAPAIGVQFGAGRGGPNVDLAFDVVSGNGSFTEISTLPSTDASLEDGFTLSLTFTDNGAADAGLSITSTGLSSDLNVATTVPAAYSSFADSVYPNVSGQGSEIDLASINVVPEPSSAVLLSLCTLGIAIRRRF